MNADELKKTFDVSEKAPFVTFKGSEKYKATFKLIQEWMTLYSESTTKLEFLVVELEKIPQQATDCLKAAPNELGDVTLKDAPSLLKACGAGVLEVKSLVEELLNDIADDWGNLHDILEILKDEIPTGKIATKMAKLKTVKDLTVQKAYEEGYGKITQPDYAALKKKAQAKKAQKKKQEDEKKQK